MAAHAAWMMFFSSAITSRPDYRIPQTSRVINNRETVFSAWSVQSDYEEDFRSWQQQQQQQH
jgi:hypothetical protein